MTNTAPAPAAPDFPALVATLLRHAEEMAERIETDVKYGDWSDADAGRALAALYRRAAAWPTGGPVFRGFSHGLVCSVEGPNADVWGYAAGELLDFTGQDLVDARIDEIGEGKYVLSW